MLITKAIIPAAGLGTRFLPATKVVPKEMLPLLDKPAIQYVVEEGVRSGIKDFLMVVNRSKKVLEDHFDATPDLEEILKQREKLDILETISKFAEAARFSYIRQAQPLGLGHAILTARHLVGKEHVGIMLPDDIFLGQLPGLAQLSKIAIQERCSVVAVQEVPLNQVSRYGIIGIKKQISANLFQIREVVEKPTQAQAPSNFAIVGRYVLAPSIFSSLEEVSTGALGELQLTDGIQHMILQGEKVFAYKIQGTRYDTGTPIEWLKANISLALKHPLYAAQMTEYLNELDKDLLLMQGKAEVLGKRIQF